jgi:uncharacterized protein YndB with AHSA1/START domain
MTESITNQLHLKHPPERVWIALTSSDAIARWLMPNDFEPRVGHRFTFQSDPVPPYWDGVVQCEVTELDPPRRLAYTWRGGPLLDTLVTYVLEPEGDGTRLDFEHSGFDLANPGHRAAYDSMKGGWGPMFEEALTRVVAELAEVR